MEEGELVVNTLSRDVAWFDAGTQDSLMDSAQFVQTIERRQGLKISCPEEVAFRKGFINAEELKSLAEAIPQNEYGSYLMRLL